MLRHEHPAGDCSLASTLPPPKLRPGGARFRDDHVYTDTARMNVGKLVRMCGLSRRSRVLDIGCGPGRLLTGIEAELEGVREYVGLDVNKRMIDWASSHLEGPAVSFRWLNVQNDRYNPDGLTFASLPLSSSSFDLAVLLSVFSHMRLADIRMYLGEIARVLAPGGQVFLTAFVEDGVPDEQENPPYHGREWSGPLHCVLLNRGAFEDAVRESGLRVSQFDDRKSSEGQSIYILDKPSDR